MIPLLIALMTLADPASAQASVSPGAVAVTDGRWSGVGLVWDAPARRVLTPLHVVEEMAAESISVVVPGRGSMPGRIVDREPALDLAILEVAGELPASAPLRTARAVGAGDPVWLPGCGGPARPADGGRVLAPLRTFAGSSYVSVRTAVAPGWSGRPILDRDGALVGIIDLALLREPGTALAIPAERAAARFPRG